VTPARKVLLDHKALKALKAVKARKERKDRKDLKVQVLILRVLLLL
jgi:hypothetical protein